MRFITEKKGPGDCSSVESVKKRCCKVGLEAVGAHLHVGNLT